MSPRIIGDGTRLILEAIRAGQRHGADIMEATGQGGGTVYKVLRRLEERGWIAGRWEDAGVAERERRPRRRYYRVTADGQAELLRATARSRETRRVLGAATSRSR
jgi:DNA-binding PadR family transcriptional regulator